MITSTQFASVFGDAIEAMWYDELVAAMVEFDITADRDIAAFLAQCAHESQHFTHTQENLNYSAKRICEVWPMRFTPATAKEYARQPEKLANFVYANRIGNGSEASGDGWHYRGRGLFMVTGKGNYTNLANKLQVGLTQRPELLCHPKLAARSAACFWQSKHLNGKSFDHTTRMINGVAMFDHKKRQAIYDQLLAAMQS